MGQSDFFSYWRERQCLLYVPAPVVSSDGGRSLTNSSTLTFSSKRTLVGPVIFRSTESDSELSFSGRISDNFKVNFCVLVRAARLTQDGRVAPPERAPPHVGRARTPLRNTTDPDWEEKPRISSRSASGAATRFSNAIRHSRRRRLGEGAGGGGALWVSFF